MIDYVAADLEIKQVSVPQRLISGYAAHHHSIDRVRDIIDPAASAKAVKRLKSPSDVGVFIGHASNALPVGIPQKIEATPQGLYTETYILKGPAGDNLLAVAKDLMDHGLSLGMSIGYKTHDSKMEHTAHGRVRRLMDYALAEYSYAPAQAIANPSALVTAVKARQHVGRAGHEQKGASMQYRVEQRDEQWLVLYDADEDGDADDSRVVGTYDSADVANAVALALRAEANGDDGEDERDEDDEDDEKRQGAADKTTGRTMTMTMSETNQGVKAEWSAAAVNDLPDSAFLYVEEGEKDEDGKTVPRSKRHFPVRGPGGGVDLPHLRNAIARIPQSNLPADLKDRLQARARRMLANAGGGKTYTEPDEWQSGAPLAVYGLGCRLQDLAETMAGELKAMALLGEETKGYQRIRAQTRDELRAIQKGLGKLLDHAETIDRGEDGLQRLAWYKAQLALTEF